MNNSDVTEQKLLDFAALFDPEEGLRQGLEDIAEAGRAWRERSSLSCGKSMAFEVRHRELIDRAFGPEGEKQIPFGNDKQEKHRQRRIQRSLRSVRPTTPFGQRPPVGDPGSRGLRSRDDKRFGLFRVCGEPGLGVEEGAFHAADPFGGFGGGAARGFRGGELVAQGLEFGFEVV